MKGQSLRNSTFERFQGSDFLGENRSKGGYYRRFGGLFFGNRGLFFAQRNPTRDKRSHEEPQTKNHGRSFLCLSRLLDVTRRKTRTLEKTGGPCFSGKNRPKTRSLLEESLPDFASQNWANFLAFRVVLGGVPPRVRVPGVSHT